MSEFNDMLYASFENMMKQGPKILGNKATSYTEETPGQVNSTEPFINSGTLATNVISEEAFVDTNFYGYCPVCRAPGVMRERRMDGNDKCKNGHSYPNKLALKYGIE